MLYRGPIERYATLVQRFPASESHHHSAPGGMLDHALETVAYALRLRQLHLLPIGAPSEHQAAQTEAWTAAVAYGALLHDIGKIAVDLHVEFADGTRWHPWHGAPIKPYRFRYQKGREYRLHSASSGLLYTKILDSQILDWLCGFPELWSALIYLLAGQVEHSGILGDLVQQADQASVAQYMGGDPAKAKNAPRHTLQRKLVDGLRYLVKEALKLNQPQASDGWLTQDALFLVSKTVCDKLRAHLLSQGTDSVPSRNTDLFNVMQEHGLAQPTPEGKAIWRATVVSENGWTNSFTFLRVAPALIWGAGDRPASFRGTVHVDEIGATADEDIGTSPSVDSTAAASRPAQPLRPSAPPPVIDAVDKLLSIFDEPGQNPTTAENVQEAPSHTEDGMRPVRSELPDDSADAPAGDNDPGARFMSWLNRGVQGRRLKINDARALVHTVAGTVYLVSPGVFQRYCNEFPQIAWLAREAGLQDWVWVQKKFEHLRAHKKQPNGLNIWTCEVCGARKSRKLHGYLLNDGGAVLPDIPFDNPHLKLLEA